MRTHLPIMFLSVMLVGPSCFGGPLDVLNSHTSNIENLWNRLASSPFRSSTPVSAEDSSQKSGKTASATSEQSPSELARQIVARRNAIPNLPWNWKTRDKILLDGAKTVRSTQDVLFLARATGLKKGCDDILLNGIHTPRNYRDVKALCDFALKQKTKEAILLANVDKMTWKELVEASALVSADGKDQMLRMAQRLANRLQTSQGNPQEAGAWLTDPLRSIYLAKEAEPLRFGETSMNGPTISLDETQQFQAMDGFGFALTGGSASLINNLPEDAKQVLLQKFFSPDGTGIGVSLLRISIGASDLSPKSFSYDDVPSGKTDKGLQKFDISAGDQDLIPVLKDILAINPAVRIIATPWSAPPWMKSNKSFIGGKLKSEYSDCYARYFVKYLQAMQESGIAIHAITPQNEPMNGSNEPSMVMTAEEQSAFIKNHLGPALRNAGFDSVEIFCWDHNCDNKEYPLTVLADPQTREYVSGSAWHLYGGRIETLSEVKQAFSDKKIYFTEQWTNKKGNFAGDFRWHIGNVLIGSIRNWSQAVLEWNLASDPSGDPHTPKGCPDCQGAVTISAGDTLRTSFNVSYFIIGHASRFVRPGSIRISSNSTDSLTNVAFLTNDGKIVLIVLNDTDTPKMFNIQWHGKNTLAYLNRGAAGTFVWEK